MSVYRELEFLLFDLLNSPATRFFNHSQPDVLLEVNGSFKAFGQMAVYESLLGVRDNMNDSEIVYNIKQISDEFYEMKISSYKCGYSSIEMEIKNSRYCYFNLKQDTIEINGN